MIVSCRIICLCLTSFVHSVGYSNCSYISLAYSSELYEYIQMFLSTLVLINISVVSTLHLHKPCSYEYLHTYVSFHEYMHIIPLGACLAMELQGRTVRLALVDNVNRFPKDCTSLHFHWQYMRILALKSYYCFAFAFCHRHSESGIRRHYNFHFCNN